MTDLYPTEVIQLNAANCEQRMSTFFNHLKYLQNVPLRN